MAVKNLVPYLGATATYAETGTKKHLLNTRIPENHLPYTRLCMQAACLYWPQSYIITFRLVQPRLIAWQYHSR